jgi:hypothetical protein
MDCSVFFDRALGQLHDERRYRVFELAPGPFGGCAAAATVWHIACRGMNLRFRALG